MFVLGQEKFLRHALTSFPHPESVLWRHVVSQVGSVEVGVHPTALSTITSAINGFPPMRSSGDVGADSTCSTCGDGPECGRGWQLKLCQRCKRAGYCSVVCQRMHWFTHKRYCSSSGSECKYRSLIHFRLWSSSKRRRQDLFVLHAQLHFIKLISKKCFFIRVLHKKQWLFKRFSILPERCVGIQFAFWQ